ncbi:MAG TPA: AraC family transcriptional regulator [Caulobacteraceae bacterium]
MPRPATAQSYSGRLRRVAAHIAAHLDEPLDLERLAAVACLSPHHFHRIYHAAWGETAAETLSRLRLHRAAVQLLTTVAPITGIARRAGYGSLAAFSRAFAAAYRATPSAFRARGSLGPRASAPSSNLTEPAMAVVVQDRPPMRIAYLTHRGPHDQIGPTFERLYAWAAPRGLTGPHAVGVAVYLDDLRAVPPAELRTQAGVSVAADVGDDGEVRARTLDGGRFAVLLYKGSYAGIAAAYAELHGWLATSDEARAPAPVVEVYLNDPHTTAPEDLLTEIRLPLR